MNQKIVVIGAGFAGMWSALAAARVRENQGLSAEALEITVVAPAAALTMRPRLYEDAPETMFAPLQALFDATDVRFVAGMVETIDGANDRIVVLGNDGGRSELTYDRLILAAGSRVVHPPIPGLADYAFSVDQLDDASVLDRHVHALASRPRSVERDTVVIAGGGFTGIETAAEFPARLRQILGAEATPRVIVVERESAIGPDLGSGPRPIIERALADLGVECRLGVAVSAIDAHGVTLANGEHIESATVIWTGGLHATPLTAQVDGEKDGLGRLLVDADLKVIGSAKIFATGDAASADTGDNGHRTLMSCQHALVTGKSAGNNAAADLLGLPTLPYEQLGYGTCLDLGPAEAVVTKGWDRVVQLSGSEAKTLKHNINSVWIYPPSADRAAALAAAEPGKYATV